MAHGNLTRALNELEGAGAGCCQRLSFVRIRDPARRDAVTMMMDEVAIAGDAAARAETGPVTAHRGGRRFSGKTPEWDSSLPVVTVITAVFNGAAELERSIRSVLALDYGAVEYIVVDGASRDGTLNVLRAYDERIDAWVSEPDRGIGDAWNKGLALASGTYICLLNCGDAYAPGFIRDHLQGNLGEDALRYGTTYLTEGRRVLKRCDREFDPASIEWGFGFLHTSCLVPRQIYDYIGPFDIRYRIAIDSDWLLRAHRAGVPFVKTAAQNYMCVGGVSDRGWNRAQEEYLRALIAHGFVVGASQRMRFRILRRLQGLYRSLNIGPARVHARLQAIFCLLALGNLSLAFWPFWSARWLTLSLLRARVSRRAIVHQRVRLFAFGRLSIGDGTVVNRGCYLDNRQGISIGCNVSIAHDCRIYTLGHDMEDELFGTKGAPVAIDDHAVVFAGAMIMPGVHIGRGAVVLPGSVVTRSVEPKAVVGGNPARVVGARKLDPGYALEYDYWFPPS